MATHACADEEESTMTELEVETVPTSHQREINNFPQQIDSSDQASSVGHHLPVLPEIHQMHSSFASQLPYYPPFLVTSTPVMSWITTTIEQNTIQVHTSSIYSLGHSIQGNGDANVHPSPEGNEKNEGAAQQELPKKSCIFFHVGALGRKKGEKKAEDKSLHQNHR